MPNKEFTSCFGSILDFQNLDAAKSTVDSHQVVNVFGHFLTRLVIVLFRQEPPAFSLVPLQLSDAEKDLINAVN